MPFQPTDLSADDVRAVLRTHLPQQPLVSVMHCGEGWDDVIDEVDGDLLVRFGKNPDPTVRAALTRCQARVLAVAGRAAPVPVPDPVLVVPSSTTTVSASGASARSWVTRIV